MDIGVGNKHKFFVDFSVQYCYGLFVRAAVSMGYLVGSSIYSRLHLGSDR